MAFSSFNSMSSGINNKKVVVILHRRFHRRRLYIISSMIREIVGPVEQHTMEHL